VTADSEIKQAVGKATLNVAAIRFGSGAYVLAISPRDAGNIEKKDISIPSVDQSSQRDEAFGLYSSLASQEQQKDVLTDIRLSTPHAGRREI
jgi:hypothetical protein